MMYRAVNVYWISVLLVPSVAQQMSARVVNGTAAAGRLEILYNGTWGTVCEEGFGQRQALVACRMLGFNSTTAVAVGSAKYGAGSGPVLFSHLQCVGHETSLDQCYHWGLYNHNCDHWQDVGVMCNFNSAPQMSARVVGGTADAGRLEILYDGTWGTVCDYRFGMEAALVACRMLGFNSTTAVAVGSAKYGAGSGPILFNDLQCVGNETSLAQCKHWGLYRHSCKHWRDVGVMCNINRKQSITATPMTARLYGGTSKAGRLEISVNGEWTTVCEDGFLQSEVEVALRMLGFNSTGQAPVKYLLVNDGSRFQFNYMTCQRMKANLQQCEMGQLNKSNCLDVGIIYEFKSFSLRLTGPRRTDSNMGRVEVVIGSKQFSTVCINNEKTAAVICRQLKLSPDRAELIDGWLFTRDKRPSLQATFTCEGTESSLDECVLRNTAMDCYSDDVGISCSSDKRLLIVSRDERYPFIEGGNKALRCVTPRKYELVTEYTWGDTAGGHPCLEFLSFYNLTKEYNGRQVSCSTSCRERDSNSTHVILSAFHMLNVYYKPVITITWTDHTGEQQPLSSLSELNPGHNVTLWCKADSNPPPASITWSGRVNSTTMELRILAADHVTHSGVYTCTVVTGTVDDDDRLPLTSSYHLNLSVQEAICGDRIGKCYCDADLVSDVNNITKMCNNYQHFTQCIGKLKDCDAGEIRQQAALFIAMIEAICKTACPEAFQCSMGSKGQTKSLLGLSDVTGNICRDLIPRFQCLTNNTRTCSASVSDKWQRVVTSYKEVCSEFDEYMTDPSPCENIQTCVDKAEVVPGVRLGDWRSNETVFYTHTKELTTGMLNPGTWCSIVTHAVGCVDQHADVCNVTMKEKEMVASMKISVGDTCKDTHVSNESGIPKSGFERLSSSGVLSFLMAATGLLKI